MTKATVDSWHTSKDPSTPLTLSETICGSEHVFGPESYSLPASGSCPIETATKMHCDCHQPRYDKPCNDKPRNENLSQHIVFALAGLNNEHYCLGLIEGPLNMVLLR
jgi:hypothetical protein